MDDLTKDHKKKEERIKLTEKKNNRKLNTLDLRKRSIECESRREELREKSAEDRRNAK